jgi:septal ring-binding cell division protein DamX
MNYEFSLTKIALFSMIAGSIVIGILMFSAGLIVGSQWLAPSAAAAEAVAQKDQSDVPAEPVLHEPEAAAPKAPKATVKPEATAAAAPTARIPALPPAGVTVPSAAAAAAQAQATNVANSGAIQIIQEEAAADQSGEGVAGEPEYVTVQVGVFTDQNEANRVLKDFERRGYSPSFFTGRDAEARQWYAVRIGSYSDRQQAANAAANFTRQEKRKAVVRPVGSL